MKLRDIHIIEKDPNKKGDLFGRLMGDLFHTFGYDEPRLNIHQSGREIDLSSFHRTESKIAIAECKAHSDTIGGKDINKFIGVLDGEKRKFKKSHKTFTTVGYFISLSGFKETAIEQESTFNNSRVVLIKPEKIIEELIKGKIIVSIERAISFFPLGDYGVTIMDYVDLIAYEKGWVWVLYFSDSEGQAPSHFGLVHAEGKLLIESLSSELIQLDIANNNIFSNLLFVNNSNQNDQNDLKVNEAKDKYFKYLDNELGDIHFEGLPTDKEAGAVKIKLENIFIPLHLILLNAKNNGPEYINDKRVGVGNVLSNSTKLAILAKPGGGKSTLLKRIAIAYAFPSRRKEIGDELPDKDWFPIFIRCRELGDNVANNITRIISDIPIRAEIESCKEAFSTVVSNSLQTGNALLLIDGLDEIIDDRNRISFINQLRTFIATYPTINIIVTSREAGFRVVGGSLSIYCDHYKLAGLVESEIEELCVKWHKAIIDDSVNTINEALRLSELIINDNRLLKLAENPLLLTTLLFVRRWAGYLPTKRSVLYQEMIKLLLVTWNVEGHIQLDIEEAEPQLAFVAYWMVKQGLQTINEDKLKALLIEARRQLPEILGYTNISPSEFIKRVESRSSLLIMSGHVQLESGLLTQVYEFLHLSFQEYLAAKAIVKLYIPQIDANNGKLDLITSNVENEKWKEVIPLVAVLLEREAKDLIIFLIKKAKEEAEQPKRRIQEVLPVILLGNCLANEIQITPELLSIAIEWFVKNKYRIRDKGILPIILNNKFGSTYRTKVSEIFFGNFDDEYSSELGGTLGEIFLNDNGISDAKETLKMFQSKIEQGSKEEKCKAILGLMEYAFMIDKNFKSKSSLMYLEVFKNLLKLVKLNDYHYQFSISWCVVWSIEADLFPQKLTSDYTKIFLNFWIEHPKTSVARNVAWALTKLLTTQSSIVFFKNTDLLKQVVVRRFKDPLNEYDMRVSATLGYLLKISFDSVKLKKFFEAEYTHINPLRVPKNLDALAKVYGFDKKNTNSKLSSDI